jgi:hypothetical protein
MLLLVLIYPFFRFTRYLNRKVDIHLPSSADTIRGWTIRTFEGQKKRIRKEVQDALSKIHITVDLWTSGNRKSILGIIGHYIGKEGKLVHLPFQLVR